LRVRDNTRQSKLPTRRLHRLTGAAVWVLSPIRTRITSCICFLPGFESMNMRGGAFVRPTRDMLIVYAHRNPSDHIYSTVRAISEVPAIGYGD
jgi:hypothetical protein